MARKSFIVPWTKTWYAPIQMKWGTLQSFHVSFSAKRAWESFCRGTGKTKNQLIQDGYRVKRLTITMDQQV